MEKANVFSNLPANSIEEFIDKIHEQPGIYIERILSNGRSTPENEWYNQKTDEWVLVLRGKGKILFKGGHEEILNHGDYIFIPRHKEHRVVYTDQDTLWLAIHIDGSK